MSEDPYSDPATGCLYNLLGIDDSGELARAEADLTYIRAYRLATSRIRGGYDLDHLQAFHRYLFHGIYRWAGQLRTVAIAKTEWFCLPQHITSYASDVFAALAEERYLCGRPRDKFVARLAHFYIEVNAIHPFREGNGRAQRAFLAQLARDAGYVLSWARMDPEYNVAACIAGFRGDEKVAADLLHNVVYPR